MLELMNYDILQQQSITLDLLSINRYALFTNSHFPEFQIDSFDIKLHRVNQIHIYFRPSRADPSLTSFGKQLRKFFLLKRQQISVPSHSKSMKRLLRTKT